MRHQLAQVRRVALGQDRRLRVLLLRSLTHYEDLLRLQPDGRVHAYVFRAAVCRVDDDAVDLELTVIEVFIPGSKNLERSSVFETFGIDVV